MAGVERACLFCQIAPVHPLLQLSSTAGVAFQDIKPAAFRHYLVIPVKHISTVKNLERRTEDFELVSHMLNVGKGLLQRDAPESKEYRFGFHQPPFNSVDHLHLHCLALPFIPKWKHAKYMSLGPLGGFIEAEKMLEKIRQKNSQLLVRAPMAGVERACLFCQIARSSTTTTLLHNDTSVVAFQDIKPAAFSYFMDIVEKMKNWDTWDAMVKDLRPYLDEVCARVEKKDVDSIIQDFYILELLIQTKVSDEFSKAINELLHSADPYIKAYNDVVDDIVKLHHNSDELDDVLAQTQLYGYEKDMIRQLWKKQNAIETKGDENLVVEDSKMGEYLKAKCSELDNIKAKIDPNYLRQQELRDFRLMIYNVRDWVRCQKIFHKALPELRNEHKERIQNMWPEDNSCSSTQAKKWHASSEDNICRPKRPKLDEC